MNEWKLEIELDEDGIKQYTGFISNGKREAEIQDAWMAGYICDILNKHEAFKAFVQGIAENTPRNWNADADIDWLRAQAYVLWTLGEDARALLEKDVEAI